MDSKQESENFMTGAALLDKAENTQNPTKNPGLAELVRRVLIGAGNDGISVSDFFNNPTLEKFNQREIENALRAERGQANVKLGAGATRFYWVR